MPVVAFSTMSIRPTPCAPAMVSRLFDQLDQRHLDAVGAHRHARLELDLDIGRLVRTGLRRRASARRCPRAIPARDLRGRRARSSGPTGWCRRCRDCRSSAGSGSAARLAYSISSARDMPQLRAGARTVIDGSSARTPSSSRSSSFALPLQPCATVVAPSMRATSTSLRAISGRAERGGQRIAVLVERAGLQRRQDVVARELLARRRGRARGPRHARARARGRRSARAPGRDRASPRSPRRRISRPATRSRPRCRARRSTPERYASIVQPIPFTHASSCA